MANTPILPHFEKSEKATQYLFHLYKAMENEKIYNPDFQSLKSGLNREFDKLRDHYIEPFRGLGNAPDSGVIWDTGYSLHEANASLKRLQKRCGEIAPERQQAFGELLDLYEEARGVWHMIQTIKPFIVKGRKPSDKPRKTPPRTLDNTGTCAVCGQNVKMSGKVLVAHGYTIRRGWQEGNCFGVRHQPIEISPEGAEAYLKFLERVLHNTNNTIGQLGMEIEMAEEDAKTEEQLKDLKKIKIAKHNAESQKRMVEYDIQLFTKKVATWKPGKLPQEIQESLDKLMET